MYVSKFLTSSCLHFFQEKQKDSFGSDFKHVYVYQVSSVQLKILCTLYPHQPFLDTVLCSTITQTQSSTCSYRYGHSIVSQSLIALVSIHAHGLNEAALLWSCFFAIVKFYRTLTCQMLNGFLTWKSFLKVTNDRNISSDTWKLNALNCIRDY